MGEYWFAAGLLLSIFGPLAFLVPVALLYYVLRRARFAQRLGIARPGAQQAAHLLCALGLVAVAILLSWMPGRLEFAKLCDELAEPRIHARVKVDGFYLDDLTANSFGMRYLHDEGFAWMEARDIYRRDGYVRYRKDGKGIATDPVPTLTATHKVRSGVDVRANGIHVARTEISDRTSGKVLAEAHSVIYHGGPLGILLGVYGLATCPDPVTADGNRQFRAYYHLAREVLGGGLPPVK
jgi:hypothetical protein